VVRKEEWSKSQQGVELVGFQFGVFGLDEWLVKETLVMDWL
jgi:hypothetical protein